MDHTRTVVIAAPSLARTARLARPALAFIAWMLAACAPHIEAAGPPVVAPALGGDHLRAADGARLPLRVWPANPETRAVVIAVHGFNDYSNAFDTPARYWAARGIAIYAYDQRGFGATEHYGLWPGTETMVDDLATITDLVRAKHPGTPAYLLGESMGGAVVMALMARDDAPAIDGVVLVAPAVWGWRTMNPFYRATLWLGAHIVPWATVTGRGLGIRPSDNREMLVALSKDQLTIKKTRIDSLYGLVGLMDEAFVAAERITVPALVLYGEHDDLVPEEPTYRMLRRLSAPHRVAVYAQGFHMLLRDLQADAVLADVAAWIADAAAPLPSGEERRGE
ncbi:MAG: alpha/beta hydrolase, partial [Alphaproteobacteria bacterium]